jgi:hypothetical protein
MRNGKPRLAGARRPYAEGQRMALQCPDIGILCSCTSPNRPFAQVDLRKAWSSGRRFVIEQRALCDNHADGAIDIAG